MIVKRRIWGCVLAVWPLVTSAYSIPTHRLLTRKAVEIYKTCARDLKLNQIPSVQDLKRLESGNIREDLDYSVKAFNWHYYHPRKNLGGADFGFGSASLEPRFKKLQAEMSVSPSFSKLGQMMHYVQDLTVPAHVAPIYHSVDSFDTYPVEDLVAEVQLNQTCSDLFSTHKLDRSYFELLREVAFATLDHMNESFIAEEGGEPVQIRWRKAFWKNRGAKNSFGIYGDFGNRFGRTEIGNYRIPRSVYEEFARIQIESAIFVSAQMIAKSYYGTKSNFGKNICGSFN